MLIRTLHSFLKWSINIIKKAVNDKILIRIFYFFLKRNVLESIMLKIDLWHSSQSGISGTGCSSCLNKVITRKQAMHGCKQIMWITKRKNAETLWIICTQVPPAVMFSLGESQSALGTWHWLRTSHQGSKDIRPWIWNQQCWLRRGPYSSCPSACVCILWLCLSVIIIIMSCR